MMRTMRDERGVVIDWLIKLVVMLAIFGVILFDAGSIVVNYFTLDSAADDTALALSLVLDPGQFGLSDVAVFEQTKQLIATDETLAADAKVVRNGTFIDEQGIVHVKLRRTADTLVVKRISAIADWAKATGQGQASTD